MKQKQKRKLEKMQAVYSHKTIQNESKIQLWKDRFAVLRKEVTKEKEKWIDKYNKLEQQLAKAKDCVYTEKARCRTLVQKQIDETDRVEKMLQNYTDTLEEEKEDLRRKMHKAVAAKCSAERSSTKSKKLAKDRLDKWHAEKHLRRIAVDFAVQQQKITQQLQKTMQKYNDYLSKSKDKKRKLQKEWADEEAAHKQGGARRWPIWVVQLICELLVNGTAPSAIPSNIQTMYETLYGETPADLPSVNFVRQCRVVVEVIGETVTALKLASANNWKALWTDATTRRQIPFTALVIGLLSNEEAIDPIIISSCIFMEDECSDTQAEGIVAKVSHVLYISK